MAEPKPRKQSLSEQVADLQVAVREIPRLERRIISLEDQRKLDIAEHAQDLTEHKQHTTKEADRVTSMIGRTELSLKNLSRQVRAILEHVGAPDPLDTEDTRPPSVKA